MLTNIYVFPQWMYVSNTIFVGCIFFNVAGIAILSFFFFLKNFIRKYNECAIATCVYPSSPLSSQIVHLCIIAADVRFQEFFEIEIKKNV